MVETFFQNFLMTQILQFGLITRKLRRMPSFPLYLNFVFLCTDSIPISLIMEIKNKGVRRHVNHAREEDIVIVKKSY